MTSSVNPEQMEARGAPELLGSAKMADPLSKCIARLWALPFFLGNFSLQFDCLQAARHLSS